MDLLLSKSDVDYLRSQVEEIHRETLGCFIYGREDIWSLAYFVRYNLYHHPIHSIELFPFAKPKIGCVFNYVPTPEEFTILSMWFTRWT